jgi:hypothetical protein
MAGQASPGTIAAMRLVLAGVVPYTAAQQCKLHKTTLYRNRLYKLYMAGKRAELEIELDRLEKRHATQAKGDLRQ